LKWHSRGQLIHSHLDWYGVVSGEAGEAEEVSGQADSAEEGIDGEVAEGISTEEGLDFRDGLSIGDEFPLSGHVDAEEAGVTKRGSADAEVDLFGAGVSEQLDDMGCGGAADDAVVDDHQPFAGRSPGRGG